jgi:hypothetical protein
MRILTRLFLLPLLALLGTGCLSAARPPSEPTDLSEGQPTLEELEEQTVAESKLRVNRNFELSKHTTYFASSADGAEWTLLEEPVAHYASVPDLVALDDQLGPFPPGTLLVYFVDGTQDHGREDVELGLVWSTDGGASWSDRLYTSMDGQPADTIAVDPSLVELGDGRLRLYYFDFETSGPYASGADKTYRIHTAVSTDGINFDYEGIVFESSSLITDPDVVEWNGEWRMYTMSQERVGMQVSVSEDPLSFGATQAVNNNGIPGLLPMGDEMWLYSCGPQGITRLVSDDGITFELIDQSIVEVRPGVHCDPSVDKTADGYAMVLKHIRAEDVRQPPQPPK